MTYHTPLRNLLILCMWQVFAFSVHAQTHEALQVKEITLSNGLKVWVNQDHSQPTAFGAVVVRAGAVDCPNTGIAHYFEHIMFKGTDSIGTVDYTAPTAMRNWEPRVMPKPAQRYSSTSTN